MTTQTVDRRQMCRAEAANGCLSIAEIHYLIETGRIDHVILAGTAMVSLDGLRAYLERHADHDPDAEGLLTLGQNEAVPTNVRLCTADVVSRFGDAYPREAEHCHD